MQSLVLLSILCLTWIQDAVESVRITELRVATHMPEGGEAVLGCRFNMEDDTLYSLKWYKDGREFYRFVPQADRPTKIFYVPGVNVDLTRSSTNFVALKHLTRESAGVYRCEVYGESPQFTMVHREKHVAVDLLPKVGPQIVGLQKGYAPGSKLNVNCTTTPSRPEAQLAWYINGYPAPKEHLEGPVLVLPTSHPYSYQAKLNLHFTVYESHYTLGAFSIKCQATIPPLYRKETEYSFYDQSLLTSPTPATQIDHDTGHAAASLGFYVPCLVLQVLLLLVIY